MLGPRPWRKLLQSYGATCQQCPRSWGVLVPEEESVPDLARPSPARSWIPLGSSEVCSMVVFPVTENALSPALRCPTPEEHSCLSCSQIKIQPSQQLGFDPLTALKIRTKALNFDQKPTGANGGT